MIRVVTPAHQAESMIARCIRGLLDGGFAPDEILVVDDGSTDGTGDVARNLGVKVIRNETATGAARARNQGVAATEGEIVLFVDADVAIKPGAREQVLAHFRENPDLAAVFGSYDAAPSAPRWVSQYRNLLHHYVHQTSARDAKTFWTGYGAVRRDVFLAHGGLDPAWPIEDVEFGLRLSDAGASIRLDPDLQATHMKDWTYRSFLKTDLFVRAIPWARLLRSRRAEMGDLNLSVSHRLSACLAAAVVGSLPLIVIDARVGWLTVAGILAFVATNAGFFKFLARARGPTFALAALPAHMLHYLAALAGYVKVRLLERGA